MLRAGLYWSPISAHEHSERSIHYGPSKIIHVEDFEKGKYILGRYDRWISCNTINQIGFFFWRFGSQVTGFENDPTKPLDYTWDMSKSYYKLYGIIQDDRIKSIEITLKNGVVLAQNEFYEDMFLLTWKSMEDDGWDFQKIVGYDLDRNVVCIENY